jgi:hypothetical protein
MGSRDTNQWEQFQNHRNIWDTNGSSDEGPTEFHKLWEIPYYLAGAFQFSHMAARYTP